MINQFLDTDGDGTGTTSAVGNYSSAADDFYVQAPANYTYHIERMIVSIEDTSGMIAGGYGDTGAALTNGISLLIAEGATTLQNLTPAPIKTNAQWGVYCYDVDIKEWGTTPTNELLLVRWTFSKSGKPISLRSGQKLVIRVNDDLTGLLSHRFLVQGHKELD